MTVPATVISVTSNLTITDTWNYTKTDGSGVTQDNSGLSYQALAGKGNNIAVLELARQENSVTSGSTTATLDLTAQSDPAGTAVDFLKVTEIVIQNLSTNTGDNLMVGGAGTNAWTAPFAGSTTAQLTIQAGGILVLAAPLLGYTVSGTSRLLQFEYSGASGEIDFIVVFKGTK